MDLINHLLDFFEVDLLETQASKLINESKITLNKKASLGKSMGEFWFG